MKKPKIMGSIKKDGKGKHIIDFAGAGFYVHKLEDGVAVSDLFSDDTVSKVCNAYWDGSKT